MVLVYDYLELYGVNAQNTYRPIQSPLLMKTNSVHVVQLVLIT